MVDGVVAAGGPCRSNGGLEQSGRRSLQPPQGEEGTGCLVDRCHGVRSLHIGGLGAQVSHTARLMLCIWGPGERTEVPDTEVCGVCVCVCATGAQNYL